jgi:hypothetical protein
MNTFLTVVLVVLGVLLFYVGTRVRAIGALQEVSGLEHLDVTLRQGTSKFFGWLISGLGFSALAYIPFGIYLPECKWLYLLGTLSVATLAYLYGIRRFRKDTLANQSTTEMPSNIPTPKDVTGTTATATNMVLLEPRKMEGSVFNVADMGKFKKGIDLIKESLFDGGVTFFVVTTLSPGIEI